MYIYVDIYIYIYVYLFLFFPRATSEGFLLCRSSAGAKLSFPAGLRVRCGGVAGALRVRCGRIEIDDSSMILAHLAGK